MERDEIEQLIYRILATEGEEIDCDQVFELIARYVDMEVAGEDATRLLPLVHQHLVQCNNCSELHDTLHELAVLEEQAVLPDVDDLLDQILGGSQTPTAGQISDSSIMSQAPPSSHNAVMSLALPEDRAFRAGADKYRQVAEPVQSSAWFRWGWAAAAVALIFAVTLGAWGWRQSSQLTQMRSDVAFIAKADRAFWMKGTEQDPDARGYLFIDETGGRGLLTIDGLNPLPSDQVYQMWLMTESGAVSAGTFSVGSDQRGRIYFDLSSKLAQFRSLAITPEPKGGSSAPTSSPVCVWGKQS
ncbi:MAG: anti-sigma factor [Anaerolineae bacterium]